MELGDHFNERIINTFMPARVLHCWQKQLIRRYRLELAQIQHCFNNSFTSCIYVAQQAKGSAQSLESDIELEKRAQVRMAQKDLQKKEQEALAQQTLEAKQVATRLQQKADQPAGSPSPAGELRNGLIDMAIRQVLDMSVEDKLF